jgi:hypothetical protein
VSLGANRQTADATGEDHLLRPESGWRREPRSRRDPDAGHAVGDVTRARDRQGNGEFACHTAARVRACGEHSRREQQARRHDTCQSTTGSEAHR